MCSIVLLDISDICTQIYYLLKNKNYNVKVFNEWKQVLKTMLIYFKYEIKKNDYKQTVIISLKTVHESVFCSWETQKFKIY